MASNFPVISPRAWKPRAGLSGCRRSTTINGPITGLELNLGILDDFVKGRAEAGSKVARDKTWHWLTDDFLTRFAWDSAFLCICTRWHIDDVLGRLSPPPALNLSPLLNPLGQTRPMLTHPPHPTGQAIGMDMPQQRKRMKKTSPPPGRTRRGC